VTGTAATITGRSIVAGLVKLIPGAGALLGGAVSATTAAAVTTAFGNAYIRTLELLFTRHHGEPPTAAEILGTMREQLARPNQQQVVSPPHATA
jgi:uncharacterized protein (DUF697 family)